MNGEQLRRAMVEVAHAEWRKPVRSIGNEDIITGYWDICGWGGWLRSQKGCANGYVRVQGSGVDWCGIYIAACALRVGEVMDTKARLRPGLARYVLPSTQRMTDKARWQSAGLPLLEPIALRSVAPGDIVTVDTGKGKPFGDHFVLVEDVLPGFLCTLEGNARGQLGDGQQGHGVVFRTRQMSAVKRVYRLNEAHFEVMQ
jgi:hypothetical protein